MGYSPPLVPNPGYTPSTTGRVPAKPNTPSKTGTGNPKTTSGRVPVWTPTPKKPNEIKQGLQAELATAEEKLRWLNNNLVPFVGFDNEGEVFLSQPASYYKKTFYIIRVNGVDKNGAFKYFIKRSPWNDSVLGHDPFVVKNVHTMNSIIKLRAEYKNEIQALKNKIAGLSPTTPPKNNNANSPVIDKDKTPKQGALIYNVSAVKDAYFTKERASKQLEGEGDGDPRNSANTTLMSGYGNQTQGGITDPYTQLWAQSTNHKGMIVAWPDLTGSGINARNVAGGGAYKADNNRYGFQFQYNPQPITMSYAGAPPVDIVNYMTGQEEYSLYTAGAGSGTIEFQLMLNRTEDMKYYDSSGALIKPGVYPGRQPYGAKDTAKVKSLFNEQKHIYNKGTMYDIEFLLRTVLGVTMESKFRGKTADFGWIGAMPVEIHLGKGLRYHGNLSAFTVNHVMFNERMVPIFSTVRVAINRLPDNLKSYAGTTQPGNSPTTADIKSTTPQGTDIMKRLVEINKKK